MKRPVEDGLSLLVGAGLGAAMMYLLDPDQGNRRRTQLRRSTHDALANAGSYASSGMDSLRSAADKAASYAHQLAGSMNEAAESGSDSASFLRSAAGSSMGSIAAQAANAAREVYERLGIHAQKAQDELSDFPSRANRAARSAQAQAGSRISGLRDQVHSTLGDLQSRARSRWGSWLNRSTLAMGRDEDHHYIGQTTCALGSLALGAGLVYFFDPRQGRSRRAKVSARANHTLHETGDFMRRLGRHLANRGRGMAAKTRMQARSLNARWHGQQEMVEDAVLEGRCRAQLGRMSNRTSAVQISAHNGCITLRGDVPAEQVDALINTVIGVRGVRDVDNQLRSAATPSMSA